MVWGQSIKTISNQRVEALGQVSDAERLNLALAGARVAAFDWTLADDAISWAGAPWAMPEYRLGIALNRSSWHSSTIR